MNKQEGKNSPPPRYELVEPYQVERYKDREFELASLASSKETIYGRRLKAGRINSYHRNAIKEANNDIHAHMNNVKRLEEAKHTGAVKVTRSSSGRKDIFHPITTDDYHKHNSKPSSSTSHV